MKPTGLSLFCLVAGAAFGADPETPAPVHLSSRLVDEIRTTLPKYQPLAPNAAPLPTFDATPAPPANPDVLELPKLTVREKRPQKLEPVLLLSKAELGKKQVHDYLRAIDDEGALSGFLARIYIPLFSAPVSVRAREAYFSNKMSSEWSRLMDLAERVKELDPKEADKLKRDLDLSQLPGK